MKNIIQNDLKKYNIVVKPSKQLYGYVGMNFDSAKKFGYPWHYSHNTILLDKNLHGIQRRKTQVHEIVEKHYIDLGWPYWKAHKKASEAEKLVR